VHLRLCGARHAALLPCRWDAPYRRRTRTARTAIAAWLRATRAARIATVVSARANCLSTSTTSNTVDAAAASAQDAAPTQEIPTLISPPPSAAAGNRNRRLAMLIGAGVALVLVLGIGSVAALTFLRSESNPFKPADQKEAAAGAPDTPAPGQSDDTANAPKPADEGSAAEKKPQPQQESEAAEKKKQPSSEDAPGPAPGYNLIQTADGSLSAEVPPSWGVETGEDSEKDAAGPGSWSYFVAARVLTQYSDYEITHSLFNASKAETCAEAGPYKDYRRPPYSGKLQTWYGCGSDRATVYTLAAYPKGRECVVALNARISDEADREAIEHLVDTVEVDCGRVTSGPLAAPSGATASPGASATASPSPSPNPSPDRDYNRNYDVPNPNAPGRSPSSAAAPGGGGFCEPPAYPVEPGDPRDGDDDGCAGEE
jgi:hypothetical protein